MKIEHVAMYAKDLEAARNFFVRYLNGVSNDVYRNETTGFRSYFISFDDGARLELMNRPEIRDVERSDQYDCERHAWNPGYAHIAFSVGNREKVDALTEQLSRDGYEVESGPRMTGDGYYESCIVGIEGNRIEITV